MRPRLVARVVKWRRMAVSAAWGLPASIWSMMAWCSLSLIFSVSNERFCDLVGYSRQAIQGMPAAAFAPAPQDLRADGGSGDELAAAVQALLAEPDQRQRRRLALRGQDGRLITMTAEIQAVGQQGGAMRVLLIAQEQAPESA